MRLITSQRSARSIVSDLTFQSDTTYFISDAVSCSGVISLEGGAVIKFPNSLYQDHETTPTLYGNFNCMGACIGRPSDGMPMMTRSGRALAGIDPYYTGNNPSGIYFMPGTFLTMDNAQSLSNLRFSYCHTESRPMPPVAPVSWNNLQCVNCGSLYISGGGDGTTPIILNNCLIANSGRLYFTIRAAGASLTIINQCTMDIPKPGLLSAYNGTCGDYICFMRPIRYLPMTATIGQLTLT